MKVTYTKKESASQSSGRGTDNTYQPAQYWITVDGEKVGFVAAKARRYMESASWYAYWGGVEALSIPRPYRGPHTDTLRELKQAIESRINARDTAFVAANARFPLPVTDALR